MTQKRILELAHKQALETWSRRNEFLKEFPHEQAALMDEKRAYDEFMEISRLLWEEEHK